MSRAGCISSYMVAGLAAIPAGALYAILSVEGYDRWWTALPAIVLGFSMAVKAWKYVDKKFFTLNFSPTASGASISWSLAPAAVAVVIILSQAPTPCLRRSNPTQVHQRMGAGIVVTIFAGPAGAIDRAASADIRP